MSEARRAAELLLPLARGRGALHGQVKRGLLGAIRAGGLRRGDVLPPSRVLARDLGVARGVVVEAYAQLVAEGWLEARPGRGTWVAGEMRASAPVPAPGGAERRYRFDFRSGRPDVAAFPREDWLRAMAAATKRAPASRLLYPPPAGMDELRDELAGYLRRVRGVAATRERVVVCSGVSQALHLLAEELRRRGARSIVVEDPGHFDERTLLADRGLTPLPVAVDDEGIDAGPLAAAGARAALVTPAHQFPLGVVMSPARRHALIAWAARPGHVLIEDDYDAEFRYDRRPVGALQSLAPDHVVYLGSVSKTLAPALRLGWIVAPPDLAAGLARRKWLNDLGSPALDQLALADLLATGRYDGHIRRMRPRYRERRNALVDALRRHAPGVRVTGAAAGIHLVASLPQGADEADVIRTAAGRGIRVQGLRPFTGGSAGPPGSDTPRPPALVLGYAALSPTAIEAAIALLAPALTNAKRPGPSPARASSRGERTGGG